MSAQRRAEIAAAVGAYNQANLREPLPRNATRLLIAMFPKSAICRRSPEEIAADGFSLRHLTATLDRFVRVGFLTRTRSSNAYRLHLPPRRQP
jgi:hypothetical protein